jgi:hypothetical protein
MAGEAYQERKNANAEENQPDRSLVISGDFHFGTVRYSRRMKISSAVGSKFNRLTDVGRTKSNGEKHGADSE